MRRRIDRLVVRTVLLCAVLAGLAAYSNHINHPCGRGELGAAGMCVTTAFGGSR